MELGEQIERKIQLYDYVFTLLLEEGSNNVIGTTVHMEGRLPADMTEDETKQAAIYQHELFSGKWDWVIQKERMITLPTHNILVTVTDPIYDGSIKYRGGTVTSTLKETCPYCQDTDCDFDCPEAMNNISGKDADVVAAASTMDIKLDKEDLESNRNYNFACEALESIVLGHAVAGVNIETAAYLEGLEAAIDAVANNF